MKTSLVLTTINNPNKNIKSFEKNCNKKKWSFVVIGDKKTPRNFKLKYGNYYSLKDQKKTNLEFADKCYLNSYARKNIGYLNSIKNGSGIIVETDDDNYPYDNFFYDKKKIHLAKTVKTNNQWINIYSLFHKKKINCWPRGIPLDEIHNKKINLGKKNKAEFILQQGVCEGNPDVDAIFRLINTKINIKFKNNLKINVNRALITLNSQNTIWFKEAFPIMYLPVTCTMRCTDIWRGLIAQRILQNDNKRILFFGTTMKQYRNDHNLMNDFKDEVPMYLLDSKINEILQKIKLLKGTKNYLQNLNICYDVLIKNKIFNKDEKYFLRAWTNDIKKIIK